MISPPPPVLVLAPGAGGVVRRKVMKTNLNNISRDEAIKVLQEYATLLRAYPGNAKLDVYIVVTKKK